jgi:hypothetical protein
MTGAFVTFDSPTINALPFEPTDTPKKEAGNPALILNVFPESEETYIFPDCDTVTIVLVVLVEYTATSVRGCFNEVSNLDTHVFSLKVDVYSLVSPYILQEILQYGSATINKYIYCLLQ